MEVLEQCVTEEIDVIDLPDDCWNALEPGLPRGPEPSLTHDELESGLLRVDHTNDDRLKHPDFAYRMDELIERILIEDRPRLPRIRCNRIDRQQSESSAGNRFERCFT